MLINLPPYVGRALGLLRENGFEAYIVGGCVRDSLLGEAPKDWDITTDAVPADIHGVFACQRRLLHGEKYGTVTVLFGNDPVEITTYRNDGAYTDNRRPDSVSFSRSLREDLSRRDFTVNALAYSLESGVIDFFGGVGDIRGKIIRCVGDAAERFGEDALRILRALRFAARLGFSIERETAAEIHNLCGSLKNISYERVCSELSEILTGDGDGAAAVFADFSDVALVLLPELCAAGPEWELSLRSIKNSPPDLTLRLILLLRETSRRESVRDILRRLRFNNGVTEDAAAALAFFNTEVPPDAVSVKRALNRLGESRLRLLLTARRAVDVSRSPEGEENIRQVRAAEAAERRIDEIINGKECYLLKDLQIYGGHLLNIGFKQGKPLGDALNALLDMVITGELPNEQPALIKAAERILRG